MAEATVDKQRPNNGWKRGQSGNPKGRPKGELSLTEALRRHVDPVWLAQELIRRAKDSDTLLMYIYNRLDGMPVQAQQLSGPDGGPLSTVFMVVPRPAIDDTPTLPALPEGNGDIVDPPTT